MRSRCRRVLVDVFLLLLFLATAAAAIAQEQTGAIQGTVKDATGAVLPTATLEARSDAAVGANVAMADARGVYRFPALPPGRYIVTARAAGFAPAKVDEVIVVVGKTLTIDLTLGIAPRTESVQTVAESPLIDVTQSASFATAPRELIDRIAAGRDFSMLIAFAPGARAEPKAGGQAQIDGASGSENVFIIDGMDTTNLRTGVAGKGMYADFVEEVQVKSSGYNAEFGGSTGGVVNAVTRSGANQTHGSAGLLEQNNWGMGGVRPTFRYSPWDGNKAESNLLPFRAPWQQWTPLGHIGGPIARDRAWYFGGVAYTSNRYEEDAIFILDPSRATRHFDKTDRTLSGTYSATARLSDVLRMRLSGSSEWQRVRSALPAMEPAGAIYYGTDPTMQGVDLSRYTMETFDTDPAAYDRRWTLTGSDYRSDVVSGNVDWTLTPSLFLNTMVGYFRTNNWTPVEARGDTLVHRFAATNSDAYMTRQGFPTVPAAYQQAAGYIDGISSYGTLRNIWSRGEINANLTWFATLAGRHTVKAGGRVDRRGVDLYDGYTRPRIVLAWGAQFRAPDGRVQTGKYGYYIVNKQGYIGTASSYSYSLWAQDSWQVWKRLTVNAGLRAEREDVPSFYTGPDAFKFTFPFGDKIAPRLGFSYDVRGDGRSKIYGSFGYFYDVMKLDGVVAYSGGLHNAYYAWTLDTPDWQSISCDEGTTGCPGTLLFAYPGDSPNRTNENLSDYFGRPMTLIDPDLKPMQTGEASLGGELQLGPAASLGVRYVHKWVIRAVEDVGILLPTGEEYLMGNPGFGYTVVMNPTYPQFTTPKATRDYDSLEFRLSRRFSGRWLAEASYAYSRLWGNYSGLASSDENGRTNPNIERYYDNLYMSYDHTNQPIFGLLATDRPHVFTLLGTYDFPWGTSLGGFLILESGLPSSSVFNYRGFPVYPYDRNDLGRTPMQSELDLQVRHQFRLGGSRRLELMANILNLFDSATVTNNDTGKWRESVTFKNDDLYFGGPWEPEQMVALNRAQGITIRDNAFYMAPNAYQRPREVRFVVKYFF